PVPLWNSRKSLSPSSSIWQSLALDFSSFDHVTSLGRQRKAALQLGFVRESHLTSNWMHDKNAKKMQDLQVRFTLHQNGLLRQALRRISRKRKAVRYCC